MLNFRKRPMCHLAIGFLLILCLVLQGRSYKKEFYCPENKEILLEGKITNKEYRQSFYGNYWQITLKNVVLYVSEKENSSELLTENVEKFPKVQRAEGKYLCRILQSDTGQEKEIKIGQKILLQGKYVPWEEATNPGQFDSGKYYVSQGILGQFHKCSVVKQGTKYSAIREGMWQLRQEAGTVLQQQLGEEDGGLISAMLLGEKQNLNEDDKELYQRNGISHVLAISGLHLTLLGMGIYKILKKLLPGRKSASVVCICVMFSYCVFTGNSVSTIRATIMFALSLLAPMLGKSYDSLSALGLAAILQLFANPYVLNSSGFLLSFLAVIGVTFLGPQLQELLGAKKKVTKSLCVSLSASLATLPVLLLNYGVFPWYSVFLNLCILPAMSVLLFLSMVLVITVLGLKPMVAEMVKFFWKMGFAGPAYGSIRLGNLTELVCDGVAFLIRMILEYFEICCGGFEYFFRWDGYLGLPGKIQILLYAFLVIFALSRALRHAPMAGKLLLLTAISILTLDFHTGAEITMLDVGQGDCVVIRNDNGNVYISDCGSSSVSSVGKYRLIPYLKYKGYGKIQGIFLSHFDDDHRSGIIELLQMAPSEKIEITYLFLPQCVLFMEEDRENLENMEALAKKNKIQIVFLKQGDTFKDNDMEFICLYPKKTENGEVWEKSRNNSSLVLNAEYHNFNLLLTGDVEKEGEEEMISYIEQISQSGENGTGKEEGKPEEYGEKIRILKVAHHGSSGASGEEFLDAVNPMLSLISCGKNNSYGHPHEETLERLKKSGSHVLVTTDTGAITIRVRGKMVKVKCLKKQEN